MTQDKLDKELKESIKKATDASREQKEQIWASIKEQIHLEQGKQEHSKAERETVGSTQITSKRNKSRRTRVPKRRWLVPAVAAASIIIAISLPLAPVQALVDQVKDWFAPEKTVQHEIEGMPEASVDHLHEGANQDYVIYFDTSRFHMVQESGVDRIVLNDPPGEPYPEVSMEVYQENMTPEMAASEVEAELKDYTKIEEAKLIDSPIKGWEIHAIGGSGGTEWDDPIVRYYVFDNTRGGSFIVKQSYFLEAAEGYGARFEQMMKEFHIVNETNPQ